MRGGGGEKKKRRKGLSEDMVDYLFKERGKESFSFLKRKGELAV